MVAWRDGGDSLTDCFDDTRAFMPQNDRHGHREITLHDVQVAMAHAAGVHAHLDFSTLGWMYLNVFNAEWLPGFMEYSRFHAHGVSSWFAHDL
jgi:hypothetical protein